VDLALISTALLLGLATTLHCIGMCGSLVMAFGLRRVEAAASPRGPGFFRALTSHIMLHAGRITTYAILGTIAAGIMLALNKVGVFVDVQKVVAFPLGIAMIAAAIIIGLRAFGAPKGRQRERSRLSAALDRTIGRFIRSPHVLAPVPLGLAMGLLPCGPVYAAVALAAEAGHMPTGAAMMVAFGIGTLPGLIAVGMGARFVGTSLRRYAPVLLAVALLIAGGVLLYRGLHAFGVVGRCFLCH
jgi:sulfite exporter TauE/SafE